MVDKLTKSQRSYNMSRIRSRDTSIEVKLKPLMKSLGFTYHTTIYGHPDFANKKQKIAVFVDGCFWHGCKKHYKTPKSNVTFWKTKIAANIKRDRIVNNRLKKEGWRVIRVWEHKIRSNLNK